MARKMEREIYEIFSIKICETCKAYASTGALSVSSFIVEVIFYEVYD